MRDRTVFQNQKVNNSTFCFASPNLQLLKKEKGKMSKCRQNYHDETEAGINKQINIELFAHYSYLAMVT